MISKSSLARRFFASAVQRNSSFSALLNSVPHPHPIFNFKMNRMLSTSIKYSPRAVSLPIRTKFKNTMLIGLGNTKAIATLSYDLDQPKTSPRFFHTAMIANLQ